MPALYKAILLMVPGRPSGSAGKLVLRYQLLAGLEYQIELQKFLVLLQN